MRQQPGSYAVLEGHTFRSPSRSDDTAILAVPLEELQARPSFPGERRRFLEPPTGVEVPLSSLERRFHVRVSAKVDGWAVTVLRWLDDSTAEATTIHNQVGETRGWEGSFHDGWTGTVPVSELDDVQEKVVDDELPRAHWWSR